MILAEILFDPAEGDTAFVELLNAGDGAMDLSAFVLRVDTLAMPLPRLAEPVAVGARVLIRFDGGGTVEGAVVHAPADFRLERAGGNVTLATNDDRVADRVAWGNADGAIVPSIGGLARRARADTARGASLGRPPGATRPGARGEWVRYAPADVTPGLPNPTPPVAQLLPIDGAILEQSSVLLSWYRVPGAVRYRVQLGDDSAFARPRIDETVATPMHATGELPAGTHWWRVQAIPAEGRPAPWSRPAMFERVPPAGGDGPGDDGASLGGPSENATDAASAFAPVLLPVPLLKQHKDTRMLHLEALQEGRRRTASLLPRVPHAWDRDHGTLDPNDPADDHNCALASLAMMNRYYGGNLSQDRIGYEVWSRNIAAYRARLQAASALVTRLFGDLAGLRELDPGPEGDLHFGQGMPWERLLAAGAYALGTLPDTLSGHVPPYDSLSRDQMWDRVRSEIDAGRPVLGQLDGHALVIRGYELQGTRRLFHVNDPWSGRYAVNLDSPGSRMPVIGIWLYPNPRRGIRQEPEVAADVDGDGVVDFDELQRFRTDPQRTDSDGDGVPDKPDIASGVYEVEHGYGYAFAPTSNSRGRDYDFDGRPTELDPDSDDGGCKDGDEDSDGNGEHDPAETGNFDETDDVCGTLRGHLSYRISAVNTDPNNLAREIHDQGVILVSLRPESPGSASYVDDGSTFTYQGHARVEVVLSATCIMWGRELARGSGPFTRAGREIGATRGDDGTLVVGARADVPSTTSSAGCGGPAGSEVGERTMNFPDCPGTRVTPRRATPGVISYSFNCNTKPNLGPGWTVTHFHARGTVRVP